MSVELARRVFCLLLFPVVRFTGRRPAHAAFGRWPQ